MENRANQFADKVEKFLQPVRDIIEDFAIGDFFKAGQDTSNLVEGIFNFLSDAIDGVDWNEIGNIIGDFIGGLDFISIIKSAFTLKINIWEAIAEVWFGSFEAAPIETAIITGIGLSNKWTEFSEWWKITGIPGWWDDNVTPWFAKEKWIEFGGNIKSGLEGKWNDFSEWWRSTGFYNWWNDDVEPFFDKDVWTWDGIKEGLSASWSAAIDAIKNIWNTFANWLNDKLTWEIDPVVIAGKQIFDGATISLGKIPTFSIGGFPEDGLFMANHNELVGQFSNGRTAVANNEQIIEGISYGVKAAVEEALAPYLQQIAQNTRETADKDMSVNIGDREIARANNRGQKAMGLRIRTT